MKSLLILLTLLSSTGLILAQSNEWSVGSTSGKWLPGRIATDRWEQESWVPDHDHRLMYHSSGQIEQDVIYREGLSVERTVNEYDEFGQLRVTTRQIKSGGLWTNQTRTVYSNYYNWIPYQQEDQEYISGVWMTVTGTRSEFEFKTLGTDSVEYIRTNLEFSTSDGRFHTTGRIIWDVDSMGRRMGGLVQSFQPSTAWVNVRQESYVYDSYGRLHFTYFDVWDGQGWLTGGMIQTRYYGFSCTQVTNYEWEPATSVYNGVQRTTTEYDSLYTLIRSMHEDRPSASWRILSGNVYAPEYQDGRLVKRVIRNWIPDPDGTSGQWAVAFRESYQEYLYLGLPDPDRDENPVVLYPNPVSETLNVSFGSIDPGPVRIDVMDAEGRLVAAFNRHQMSSLETVSISQLVPGLYFVRILFSRGHHKTFRIVKF